MKKKWRC